MKIFKYKAASLVGEREIGLLLAKITWFMQLTYRLE
jgi:hypothetical protein